MTAVQNSVPAAATDAGDLAVPTPRGPRRPVPDRHRVRSAPRSFRPDIEGLRAIAVVLVVVYHADLLFSGGYVGVDVFFVISGFLITRQLVKNVGRSGLRALPTFYAHRVRRLLPAAVVVLLVTLVAVRIWAPVLQQKAIATDAVFTTFYALNYRLAALGTDYQHLGVSASPLQHFWSLGVEEQFYFVWPLVVALIVAIGRRWARGLLVITVVAVVAVSAYYSIVVTQDAAPWAYFSLHTRAWELGVGALVALSAERLVALPRRLAGLFAWVGIAAIVGSALLYTDATPFPGVAAWVPVAGTALVIAAGCGPRVRAERMLGEPLMQCLGRISYAWYLWHWPMLVLAPYVVGHDLSLLERCAVVWLSLTVALISFFAVEEPARRLHLPNLRWVLTGAAMSGAVAATAVVTVVFGPSTIGTGAATHLASAAGVKGPAGVDAAIARAVAAGLETTAAPSNLTPAPDQAAYSLPSTSRDGCHAGFTQIAQPDCVFGDAAAKKTVVLFGDSHMEQWLPAVQKAAERQHWRVVNWTKSACPPGDMTVFNAALNRDYTECDTWRSQTVARIGALQPDLVLMSQSENIASSSVDPDDFATATVRTLDALDRVTGDAQVSFLQDIPIPGTDLPGCVAAHLSDVQECDFDRDRAYSYPDRHRAMEPAISDAGFPVIDPVDWFCADTECPAVVGNVLVYRNDSHMTVPYSQWLSPAVGQVLRQAAREMRAPGKQG